MLTIIMGGNMLTKEELISLSELSRKGDIEARNIIVINNMGFVNKLWVEFIRDMHISQNVERDVLQAGYKGLIKAATLWDPSYNTAFTTYSAYWIREGMGSELMDHRLIRLPGHVYWKMLKWKRLARTGKSEEQIIETMHLTASQVKMIHSAFKVGKCDRTPIHADIQEERGEEKEEDYPEDYLYDALNVLEERERDMVIMRYGLRGTKRCTMKEICDKYGLTREWIRKLLKKSYGKLSRYVNVDTLRN